ncbi:hypothetical protein D3878_05400 [Noviherbaspirillum sedimenti]|uniref:Uncharacterized protein n=1 Tax=Noviherbaspirillum sedimenti TaxID=2320865 RepID=A0A3A3FXZ6_9BURK|nr:hypothetical protein D3878_05400 [Noviherbaspirillum sedimenti]
MQNHKHRAELIKAGLASHAIIRNEPLNRWRHPPIISKWKSHAISVSRKIQCNELVRHHPGEIAQSAIRRCAQVTHTAGEE